MSTLSLSAIKNPSSGSNNVTLNADGTTTIAAPSNLIKSATAVASTSGTAIDFTGIPSWIKRITVMFNGVSTNGSSYLRVQIGSGSIDATGYASTNGTIGAVSVSGATGGTAGWDILNAGASTTTSGTATICLLSANTWVFNSTYSCITSVNTNITAGHKSALSGVLDRVRITTANGTDTFDAGTINITWEG